MARWNLYCPTCDAYEQDVTCSIYDIPPCGCGAARTIQYDRGLRRSQVFPFTTTNVDGKPMVIESLNQLRRVERDFGVVFSAFSRDNINDVAPVDNNLPRFRGEDPDIRYEYRERYRK